jgi:hypothetical protein
MSQPAQTVPVNVRLPGSLGLSDQQLGVLEQKWQQDLQNASESAEGHARVKVGIHIKVTITIDAHN